MSDSGTFPTNKNGQIQGDVTAKAFSQRHASHGVEQQPTMRSVGIPSTQMFAGDVKRRHTPFHKRPLNVCQPLNVGALRCPSGHIEPLFLSGFHKRENPSPPSPKSTLEVQLWIVDDTILRSPPTDFPLGRTRRKFSGMKLNDAASRISRCLHTRSIKADYSKTEILATCRNVDFVEFTVRIYLDKDGILVVAHRQCGDGMSFMQDYRAIISACEGEPVKNFTHSKSREHLMQPEKSILTETKAVESLQYVAGLLASDKVDSKMLGMESLVSVSDPAKTLKATSHLCARSILCHKKRLNDFFDLHNFLMGVILHGYQSEFASKPHISISNYAGKMRNLALHATSNAIKHLKDDDCFRQIIHESHWYREVFVPSLVDHVNTAKLRPHDACFACQCLLCLASSSRDLAEKIKEEGGLEALEEAERVGNSQFALLASDATSCREKLLTLE